MSGMSSSEAAERNMEGLIFHLKVRSHTRHIYLELTVEVVVQLWNWNKIENIKNLLNKFLGLQWF